jgi:hypothetical protein
VSIQFVLHMELCCTTHIDGEGESPWLQTWQ